MEIHRNPIVCMAHEFLHRLDILIVAIRRVAYVRRKVRLPMCESIPAALAAGSRCARYSVHGYQGPLSRRCGLSKAHSLSSGQGGSWVKTWLGMTGVGRTHAGR